jgi:hypothetical protein
MPGESIYTILASIANSTVAVMPLCQPEVSHKKNKPLLIEVIPAGTLPGVSLARWWSSNEDEEIQLSGWYGY